jgi:uncharacterized coiled-coil DUF342 family protein
MSLPTEESIHQVREDMARLNNEITELHTINSAVSHTLIKLNKQQEETSLKLKESKQENELLNNRIDAILEILTTSNKTINTLVNISTKLTNDMDKQTRIISMLTNIESVKTHIANIPPMTLPTPHSSLKHDY